MGDIMTFPKRWEDFLHDYEFEDARRIYTNGSRLIPSFRVKQMMEHYAPVVRCKDCKYWQDNNDGYPHEECRWGHGETPDANDFCSYGERKEGDDDAKAD